MSDDLIKRLRDCANGIGSFKSWQGDYGICDDAADIIEQLMKERDDYKDLYYAGFKDAASLNIHYAEIGYKAKTAEAKLAKAVEALRFYGNEDNYKSYAAVDPCGCCSSWYEPKIHIDGEDSGGVARKALAELEADQSATDSTTASK